MSEVETHVAELVNHVHNLTKRVKRLERTSNNMGAIIHDMVQRFTPDENQQNTELLLAKCETILNASRGPDRERPAHKNLQKLVSLMRQTEEILAGGE